MVVGYEELGLHPWTTLKRICEFLEVEPDRRMLVPANSFSHSILGNRMRSQPAKLEQLGYDSRWLSRTGWALPAALLRPVMRYNADTVYANATDMMWRT
jgi:hypothetical protein